MYDVLIGITVLSLPKEEASSSFVQTVMGRASHPPTQLRGAEGTSRLTSWQTYILILIASIIALTSHADPNIFRPVAAQQRAGRFNTTRSQLRPPQMII